MFPAKAYHWSITQLTPASCEIYPSSARERIFNIAVILFGSFGGKESKIVVEGVVEDRLKVSENNNDMLDNSCAVFVVEVRLEMAIGAMSLGKQEVMIAIWTKNKLFLGSISNQGCVFSHLSSAPWGSNCMRFNNSIVQIVTALHGKRCWMLTQHNTTTYSTCQVAHMLEDFFQTWIRVDHQICCQSHSPPLKNVENTCKSYHQPTSAVRSTRFVAPACMGCAMPRSPYVSSAAFHFGAPDVCDAGQNHCGLCQAKVGQKQKSKKSRRKLDESGKVSESVEWCKVLWTFSESSLYLFLYLISLEWLE